MLRVAGSQAQVRRPVVAYQSVSGIRSGRVTVGIQIGVGQAVVRRQQVLLVVRSQRRSSRISQTVRMCGSEQVVCIADGSGRFRRRSLAAAVGTGRPGAAASAAAAAASTCAASENFTVDGFC